MYIRNMKGLLVFLIFLWVTPSAVRAQQWSGILSPSRAIDWSTAGVAGGIPARTTICTTLGVVGQLASFAQSVGLTQINSAIASCPSGQTILLNPGTYTLTSGITLGASNVTLRGSGADQTILVAGGGGVGCWGPAANICVQGSFSWSGGPQN